MPLKAKIHWVTWVWEDIGSTFQMMRAFYDLKCTVTPVDIDGYITAIQEFLWLCKRMTTSYRLKNCTLTSHCLLLWWLQLERGVPYWCHERSEKYLEYLIGNNMRCYHWEKSSIFATTMYDLVNAFPSTCFEELLMGLVNWLKLTTKMQDGLLCSVFEGKMNHLWPKHILKWENKHYLCWWCDFWDQRVLVEPKY